MGRYDHARFCGYCQVWMSKDYERCPICGSLLRSVPKNPQSKTRYNGRKYSREDAKRIFERFLKRGYSPEEAAEATLALTGIKLEEVKAGAEA